MHQDLPRSGEDREALREKGQFWTPDWVADAMVAYALAGGAGEILDPAVGAGAFLCAIGRERRRSGADVRPNGCELHADVLSEAAANGVPEDVIRRVRIADFVLDPPPAGFPAIVANPPYIRHHRLSAETKAELRALALEQIGRPLDGRTGYHIYFLIRALTLLAPGGRLAFIMPADTCEGVFARDLWSWIGTRFRINGAVTFSPNATPFPGVDTNAIILLLENSPPRRTVPWIRCTEPGTSDLREVLAAAPTADSRGPVTVLQRDLDEALDTGLSRPPMESFADDPKLGDFARVVRGVATGANDFFFMTAAEAAARGIPDRLLVRAVGRTRDARGATLDGDDLEALDAAGRATYLFSIGKTRPDELPEAVQDYIREGERQGLHERALVRSRKHWFRCEERVPPPFLFAYLGRRDARFIRNRAGAVPLTGFLCVYPRYDDVPLDALWDVLRASATYERLASVGKSYGGGAIKVEPRALERLPLDRDAVARAGLLSAEPERAAA